MDFTTLRYSLDNSTRKVKEEYALPLNYWIIFQCFSIFFILLSLYIFIMLIRYSCTHSIQDSGNRARSISNSEYGNSGGSTGGGERKISISSLRSGNRCCDQSSSCPLQILCLLGSFFAILRISADQLELATYGNFRINCKTYQIVVVSTYAVSATFLYAALWGRLRVFYGHPIMKNLVTTWIAVLIWFAIFCTFASAIANAAIFLLTVRSVDSSYGCVLGETTSISPTVRYVILALSTIVSQVLLLSLFLYPLFQHQSTMKSLQTSNTIATNTQPPPSSPRRRKQDFNSLRQSRKARREKRLFSLIVRVLATAVVCVLSDVTAAIVTIAFSEQPRVLTNLVFNCNLLINVISVLLSFGDWRDRFLPWCSSSNKFPSTSKKYSVSPVVLGNKEKEPEKTPSSSKQTWRGDKESTISQKNEFTFSSIHESLDKNDDVFI